MCCEVLLSAGVQREGKQLFLYSKIGENFNEEVEFYFDLKSYMNFNRAIKQISQAIDVSNTEWILEIKEKRVNSVCGWSGK